MGTSETAMEQAAMEILAVRLGGFAEQRDKDKLQGVRDFDVVDRDGKPLAGVEVSSLQVPAARATRAEFERLRQTDVGLSRSWSVTVQEERNIAPIRKGVASVLNALAASGVERYNSADWYDDPDVRQLVEDAAHLGMSSGYVITNADPPRLYCTGWGGGSVDPSRVVAAVEEHAADAGNLKKLADSPPEAERHLFLWVHPTKWEALDVLLHDDHQLPAVLLPPGVDVVWLAAPTSDLRRPDRLLRADRSAGGEWVDLTDEAKRGCLFALVAGLRRMFQRLASVTDRRGKRRRDR